MPEIDSQTGLQLGLDRTRLDGLDRGPKHQSRAGDQPELYGVVSNERIASIVHLHGRILINGSGARCACWPDYLRSEDGLPHRAAENRGADIVVGLCTKTLSFTGSQFSNICTGGQMFLGCELLRMLQTTSPVCC